MSILSLRSKAKQHYPQSLRMRQQWIRQTVELHQRGIAMMLTGKFHNRGA